MQLQRIQNTNTSNYIQKIYVSENILYSEYKLFTSENIRVCLLCLVDKAQKVTMHVMYDKFDNVSYGTIFDRPTMFIALIVCVA